MNKSTAFPCLLKIMTTWRMFSKDSKLLSLITIFMRSVMFCTLPVALALPGEGHLLKKWCG